MYAVLVDVNTRGRLGICVTGLVNSNNVNPRSGHQLVLKICTCTLSAIGVPYVRGDAIRPCWRVLAVKAESPFALA